jgi:hypothetical protein
MLLKNRKFTREIASREAKSIFIFCEGLRREYQYFMYFNELDSRINVQVYPLHPHEDNSPRGLFNIAHKSVIKTEDNPLPKYELIENDEVWLVLDTDIDKLNSRQQQLDEVRSSCDKMLNWSLAQSNPCFEVWLYFHFNSEIPNFESNNVSSNWKRYVGDAIAGGFNSSIHPVYLSTAITNTERLFSHTDNIPDIGCTELFNLGKVIYPLVKEKLDKFLQ